MATAQVMMMMMMFGVALELVWLGVVGHGNGCRKEREECLPTRTHEVYILSFCFVFHLILTLNQSLGYAFFFGPKSL